MACGLISKLCVGLSKLVSSLFRPLLPRSLTGISKASSLKLLLIPVVFYANWAALAPYVAPDLPNPFEPFIFLSHHVPTSSPDDPRYAKGYFDFLFVAYYIVFFSFVRQVITVSLFRPIGKYFGVTKRAKLDRYGEQGHALVYFTVMGIWGVVSILVHPSTTRNADHKMQRVMAQLPTWWYKTEFYWLGMFFSCHFPCT